MPGLNRRGPEGQGPRTGRGLGRCNPNYKNEKEENDNYRFGSGLAHRRGCGNNENNSFHRRRYRGK